MIHLSRLSYLTFNEGITMLNLIFIFQLFISTETAAKCSALSVLLQKGTGMFLVLMTLPLLSELI